ncbi:MAG TPA: hypothetical protein VN688_30530 [Gemmataceae bacterium]|nr:hypothetical protein [Gemmataceae bacterium]
MPDTIPNLWSPDIAQNVLPPLAILRTQAGFLGQMTKGLLRAEITSMKTEKWIQYQFDLHAPALGGYRHRLFAVGHEPDTFYPVTVEAECFAGPTTLNEPDFPTAATQDEFLKLIGQVLQSREVRSIIQTLIARSNEFLGGAAGAARTEGGESTP